MVLLAEHIKKQIVVYIKKGENAVISQRLFYQNSNPP